MFLAFLVIEYNQKKVYLEEDGEKVLTHDHLLRLNRMYGALGISTRPKDYGVSFSDFDEFFDAGTRSDRMKNSLINLSQLRRELESTFQENTVESNGH